MIGYIVAILVGVICIILGISNMKGNISSLHSYHRHRVSEENILPYGKKIGLGTIIIGVGIVAMGGFSIASSLLNMPALVIVGTVLLVAALIIGLALSIYAMVKYNGGIF